MGSSIITTRRQHVAFRLRSGLCSTPSVLSITQLTAAEDKGASEGRSLSVVRIQQGDIVAIGIGPGPRFPLRFCSLYLI